VKQAILAVVMVLGIALTASAIAPAANAYTSVFPPAANAGANS
jgi:hypothetical protein